MATIQIADKPTLDAVKAMLESSGGVITDIRGGTMKYGTSDVTVTGKGILIPSPQLEIKSIDNVSIGVYGLNGPVKFRTKIVFACRNTNTDAGYLVYLLN